MPLGVLCRLRGLNGTLRALACNVQGCACNRPGKSPRKVVFVAAPDAGRMGGAASVKRGRACYSTAPLALGQYAARWCRTVDGKRRCLVLGQRAESGAPQ